MPTLQEAAEAHLRIPEEDRQSEAPIAARLSSSEIAHRIGRDVSWDEKSEPLEKRQSIIAHDFTHVSESVSRVMNEVAQFPRSVTLEDLADEQSLMRAIRQGLGWAFVPAVDDRRVSAEEFRRAHRNGYFLQPVVKRRGYEMTAVNRALRTAVWTAQRRVIRNIVHFRDFFPVRDPLKRKRHNNYLIEQLWIATSATRSDSLRLIAVESTFSSDDRSPESLARREALMANGYEVFSAIGWWALIDPMRFIAAILSEAGFEVPDSMCNVGPGRKMADYKCAKCGKLMIRDEHGYGIVKRQHSYLHEGECFNAYVGRQ